MLNEQYFYHGIIKKCILVFGTLFNDIYVKRTEDDEDTVKLMRVPVTFAMKDKVLERLNQDPDLDKPAAITLPRISFDIEDIVSVPERSLPNLGRIVAIDPDDANKNKRVYTPVPVDIHFSLSIYAKVFEDALKIVEQIVPFFRPDWTPTVHLIDGVVTLDMPVIRNPEINISDSYDGDFKERRVLTYDMSFTMQAVMYGPVLSKPVIKFTEVNTRVGVFDGDSEIATTTVTQPGLTANGEPTSNSSASIDVSLIFANSDFGYVITRTHPLD